MIKAAQENNIRERIKIYGHLPMYLRAYRHYLIILILIGLSSCSPEQKTKEYTHKGLTLSHPEHWQLTKDSDTSLFGEREIIFKLGELSYSAFYFPPSNIEFDFFLEQYLSKVLPEYHEKSSKVETKDIKIGGTSGKKIVVRSNFIGPVITNVYAFKSENGDKALFNISVHAEEEEIAIEPALHIILSSIEYRF